MRLTILGIMLLCGACTKDYVYDFSKGKGTATKLNVDWAAEGSSEIVADTLLLINLLEKNNTGSITNHLRFWLPNPPRIGRFPLSIGIPDSYYRSSYLIMDNYNVIAFYKIRDSINSYIDVMNFDPKTGWLTAEFSSLLAKDKNSSLITRVNYPDTLSFTKGRMEILVVQ